MSEFSNSCGLLLGKRHFYSKLFQHLIIFFECISFSVTQYRTTVNHMPQPDNDNRT